MNVIKKSSKLYQGLFFLLMLSLYFGRFNINIGFSLKPFMIITLAIIVITLKHISSSRLFTFEIFMLVFIVLHSMTALNFKYPDMSIRFIILYLIIIIFYFTGRSMIRNIDISSMETIISKSGFVGIVASLLYYFMGVLASGMNFWGNNINYYGLMIDRSTPRLTGVASHDPNIFVFYVTLYFFFTITHLNNKLNKIGFILSSTAIILTFSRGAYLAIGFGLLLIFILAKGLKKKLKVLITSIFALLILIFTGDRLTINPYNYIISRFTSFSVDGGSGRLTIWSNAINTFLENPIFGIGINSIREYNLENFSRGVYVHNSLLEVLVETGVVGITIYFIFWFLIIKQSFILMKNNQETKFIFITFVAMFIQMNSLSILYNEAFYFVVLLLYRYSIERFRIDKKNLSKGSEGGIFNE